MKSPDDISQVPWDRHSWTGEWKSVDGTAAGDFSRGDVAAVVAHGSTPRDDWDGFEAAIVRLTDGRIAAWEAWWGPTGSGFWCDAYGGDADVLFAASVAAVLPHLTEKARELLRWEEAQP